MAFLFPVLKKNYFAFIAMIGMKFWAFKPKNRFG